jgi:hypothetical protein
MAEMEQQMTRVQKEHNNTMNRLWEEQQTQKDALEDVLDDAQVAAQQHMVEISFLRLKYKADDDWLYQKKFKYSLCVMLPHNDMIQKLCFRGWAIICAPGRLKRNIYELLPREDSKLRKELKGKPIPSKKKAAQRRSRDVRNSAAPDEDDDEDDELKVKTIRDQDDYRFNKDQYISPVRNVIGYEWLFATFHLWHMALAVARYKHARDNIHGNELYKKHRFYEDLKIATHRRRFARSFAETMYRAKQEYLLLIVFEIWKRRKPADSALVNEEAAHLSNAIIARCFHMWTSYVWAAKHVHDWGAEIYEQEAELPRIRSEWEQKVDALERELNLLTAGEADLIKAFEGEQIGHPSAPKVFSPSPRLTQGTARPDSPPGSPKRKGAQRKQAVEATVIMPTPKKKADKAGDAQPSIFGAFMSSRDNFLDDDEDHLNIAQLFRDPHGPLPTHPRH